MLKNDEKPIANPYVILREEFDDWAILFNPDTGRGFGLSPTGVCVWKLLDGAHSIDDVLEALRRDSDDVPHEATKHLIAFVEELTQHGLAGYEAECVRDHRGSVAPVLDSAQSCKFSYTPPSLINFGGQGQIAHGYCGFGSQAGDACAPGNAAPCCYSTGAGGDPSSGCCAGPCPNCANGGNYCADCTTGGAPGGGGCVSGGGASGSCDQGYTR